MRPSGISATLGSVSDVWSWEVPTRPPSVEASQGSPPPRHSPSTSLGQKDPGPRTKTATVVLAAIVAAGLLSVAISTGSSGTTNDVLSRQERIDLAAQAQISTVRVAARACPGVIHGSGFVVNGLLFTSGHIAVHDQRLKVDRPGQPVESAVMATSASLDVAVADAAGLIAVEMSLGPEPAQEGENVFLAGFPDGRELEMFEATITRYGAASEWGVGGQRVMLLEPPIRAGFSGGPVLDRNGLVVGMLAGVDAVTGLSVAIPSDELGPIVSLAVETWGSEGGNGDSLGSVAHSAQACGS